MKYCEHCGVEIAEEAAICTNCGCATNNQVNAPQDKWNSFAIAGFVLSFFSAIVGLILSIVGYRQTKQSGEKGKELALAGIIISSIATAASVIAIICVVIIYAALIFAAIGASSFALL